MNIEMQAFQVLLIIATSLFLGICMGFVGTLLLFQQNIKDVNDELDKFRKLYFNEVDRWKNKYTDTNPDNNLEL